MAERRLRILVVEDEMLVAMNIEDMLLDLGHEVAGLAGRLAPALALARESRFDAAMLDVNLAGEPSFPVADLLIERGIPFLFATGYGRQGIEERYRGYPMLQKPFLTAQLGEALAQICLPAGEAGGEGDHPKGGGGVDGSVSEDPAGAA